MININDLPGYDDAAPLLEVDNLCVTFESFEGEVAAVDGVSFTVNPGETLCIVGESGSGKSASQMAILGLLSTPPAIISGSVRFCGIELVHAPQSTLFTVRGSGVSMIFQDAITSLNPSLKVGFQIAEVFCARTGSDRASGRKYAIELMERVAIPDASHRVDDYPFQFSGGMCQRIMIAMALALNPKILIADEPTTALDVTVQRQVMELLKSLSKNADLALVLITHDLGVAAEQADKVMVMYAGRTVETGLTDAVFAKPYHPYTQALLSSMPDVTNNFNRLGIINGSPPVLTKLPEGCSFRPRCQFAAPMCRLNRPQLFVSGPSRASACLRVNDIFKKKSSNV